MPLYRLDIYSNQSTAHQRKRVRCKGYVHGQISSAPVPDQAVKQIVYRWSRRQWLSQDRVQMAHCFVLQYKSFCRPSTLTLSQHITKLPFRSRDEMIRITLLQVLRELENAQSMTQGLSGSLLLA